MQQIFSDDQQMIVCSKARILSGRSTVDVRSSHWIVFDDGGASLSRGSWREAYHVETSIRAVDRSSVR